MLNMKEIISWLASKKNFLPDFPGYRCIHYARFRSGMSIIQVGKKWK